MNLTFKRKPKTYAEKMKEKYGDDFFVNIGKKGGSKKVPKGFSISGKASEAGRKGGTISRKNATR